MTTPSFQPPSAAVRSLDASTTGVPNQSPSSNEASPALIPTRIANRAPSHRRLWRSTPCCIATASAIASAAAGYDTINASPIDLTSVPPARPIAWRNTKRRSLRSWPAIPSAKLGARTLRSCSYRTPITSCSCAVSTNCWKLVSLPSRILKTWQT
jgi:hypothetical protein